MKPMPELKDIAAAEAALEHIQVTFEIAAKTKNRSTWRSMVGSIGTLGEALDLAYNHQENNPDVSELAIFTEHETYGGLLIWSSRYPQTTNVINFLEKNNSVSWQDPVASSD